MRSEEEQPGSVTMNFGLKYVADEESGSRCDWSRRGVSGLGGKIMGSYWELQRVTGDHDIF